MKGISHKKAQKAQKFCAFCAFLWLFLSCMGLPESSILAGYGFT